MIEAGAGGAERVTEGDRAAVRVDLAPCSASSSRSHASTTDANASLISTVSMSSIVEAGALEEVAGRVDRAGEHQHGVDADEALVDDPGPGREPELLGPAGRRRGARRRRRR